MRIVKVFLSDKRSSIIDDLLSELKEKGLLVDDSIVFDEYQSIEIKEIFDKYYSQIKEEL